jgi:hypothetical protein
MAQTITQATPLPSNRQESYLAPRPTPAIVTLCD